LVHILEVRQSAGVYPTRISPDAIGPLLALQNIPAWVQAHCDFLRLLNEISNAYKHSFINSDAMLVGRDEPGVYALSLQRNDLERATQLHNIRITELVVRFDAFFQAALAELKQCKLPHRDPNEKKPAPIYERQGQRPRLADRTHKASRRKATARPEQSAERARPL